MTLDRRSRSARLARVLLLTSIASAASGMVLDYRVMRLLSQAREGTLLQAELERADQIATVMLLLTLLINVAVLAALAVWLIRRANRQGAIFILAAAILIPVFNPVMSFLVRGVQDEMTLAMASKTSAIIAAAFVMSHLPRRVRSTPPVNP